MTKVEVARRLLAAAREKEQAATLEAQRVEQRKQDQVAADRLKTEQEVRRDIAAIFEKEFQSIMEEALANRKSSFRLKLGSSGHCTHRLDEAIDSLGDRSRAIAKHLPTYLASEGFAVNPGYTSARTDASTDPEYQYDAYWTTWVWVDVRIPIS